MSDKCYLFGKPVKLLVDMQGYPDGRVVFFEVYRKKSNGEEKIAEVNGVIKNNKGIGYWNTVDLAAPVDLAPLSQQEPIQKNDNMFFFKAKIDEKDIKSEDLTLFYDLTFNIVDDHNRPLDAVKGKVTFSDGKSVDITLNKGKAALPNAPSGKFKIEVEGYKFIFDEQP